MGTTTASLVRPAEGGHWYKPNGEPYYEVECKSKPGTMRKTTIKDARAVGAKPSVTTVQRILAKPSLDAWKVNQGIMAALTLPKLPDESLDAFAIRVVDDMDAQSEKAMEMGSLIHAEIEDMLKGVAPVEEYAKYVSPVSAWVSNFGIKPLRIEESFCTGMYGGKCDLIASKGADFFLVDWKTQSTKKGKFNFYDEWPEQLAAYAVGCGFPNAKLISVAISTTETDEKGNALIGVKEYEDTKKHFENFMLCYRLWAVRNNWA